MIIKKEYVPGFDWVRIVGSTLIAFYHIFFSQVMSRWFLMENIKIMTGITVPIFFMISGYLLFYSITRKGNPYKYMKNYILKYGCICMGLHFLRYFFHYIEVYEKTGVFMYKDYAFVMLTIPLRNNLLIQLWFIPPLLLGVLINGIIFLKGKEAKCLPIMVILSLMSILLTTYGEIIGQLPAFNCLYTEEWGKTILLLISQFFQGSLFVYIGMLIAKNKSLFFQWNYKKWIFFYIFFSVLELFFVYTQLQDTVSYAISFSTIFWSILVFSRILKIKGQFLYKYHSTISMYSVVMYFLHSGENTILQSIGFENALIRFFTVLILNIGLTKVFGERTTHDKRLV